MQNTENNAEVELEKRQKTGEKVEKKWIDQERDRKLVIKLNRKQNNQNRIRKLKRIRKLAEV